MVGPLNLSERFKADSYFETGIDLRDAACAYRLGATLLTDEVNRAKNIPRALRLIKVSAESADEE